MNDSINCDQEGRSPAPVTSASASIRLRDSWAGQLYTRHIKHYRIVRLVAPRLWKAFYFLYKTVWISWRATRRELIPLAQFAQSNDKGQLAPRETVTCPFPKVFPESSRHHLLPEQTGYVMPACYIATIENGLVTGATNLILTDSAVIHHDLYDFQCDYTSEELHGRSYIWPKRAQIAWMMRTDSATGMERAACFTDACASNYAHWTTEVLPRICLFCQSPQSADIPLIVDAGLHPNLNESLRLVSGTEREVIFLGHGQALHVKRLSAISAAGYVAFERRVHGLRQHSHGRFSPAALRCLRQHLIEASAVEGGSVPRRIFVKRNASIRKLMNSDEIEDVLGQHGFETVEPERLTFAQQVRLFSAAEVVIGPTGAAMANLVYCKPTAKIIVMMPIHPHTSYWYWQRIASAAGNTVSCILGATVSTGEFGMHSDYHVHPRDVLSAINHESGEEKRGKQ